MFVNLLLCTWLAISYRIVLSRSFKNRKAFIHDKLCDASFMFTDDCIICRVHLMLVAGYEHCLGWFPVMSITSMFGTLLILHIPGDKEIKK